MALQHYLWSRTAASNATADANVNFAEGQAPSSVNDSCRAMMASLAGYRDDVAGAIATTGTSTAYAVTSYQVFDTLAHLNGQVVAFTPHTTNGATVTLNVDGLGAKPLRPAPSVELQSGVLIQGTPYAAVYNSSDAAFYLFGVGTDPGIPLGTSIDYWGSTAPSSHFVLAYGQAISRTTYSTLFTLFSTTFGTGDGSTTFNVPDLRGYVVAGKDDMGGSSANRLTAANDGLNGDTLGATGGAQTVTLTASQIPSITSANASQSISVSTVTGGSLLWNGGGANAAVTASGGSYNTSNNITISGSNSISVTSNNTGGTAHANVQPTIVANKLLRII